MSARVFSWITPDEADVLLRHGTEAAFCGGLLHEHRDGVFTCRLCGLPLFAALYKFESGTLVGRASPRHSNGKEHLQRLRDFSYGIIRTELQCAVVAATRGTCLQTVPHPPDSATASTRSPSVYPAAPEEPLPEGEPWTGVNARPGSDW